MRFPLRLKLTLSIVPLCALLWLASPTLVPGAGGLGPSDAALRAGLEARARYRTRLRNKQQWTLIDYDRPFTAVRLWVLDASADHAVLAHSRVSHAWKSGGLHATKFSNRPGSNLSSTGSYVTARHTYEGSYGHSLRVRGLERGVNDNAWKRAIVFHPDLGMTHSLGCFMLPEEAVRPVLDRIVGGSFVYVHRSQP